MSRLTPIPIGAAIDDLRKRLGLSYTGLAKRTGVRRQYVYKVTRSVTIPSLEQIERFAHGLGLPLSGLIHYAELLRDGTPHTSNPTQPEAQHGA